MKMKPYLRPRVNGVNKLWMFTEGFGSYLSNVGGAYFLQGISAYLQMSFVMYSGRGTGRKSRKNKGKTRMFRAMRRKKQQLSEKECRAVLERGTSGVLAVSGDDGYPYAVPLSYVYTEGKLFFHSAKSGHKIDAIMRSGKASFCVVDQDQIVPEEYTTYFRSVIAFGNENSGRRQCETSCQMLDVKCAPDDSEENREQAIEREWKPLCMLEMRLSI